ncbi:MAG: DUF1273 family protein [Oscillospiraceae bacterium]|nr:DUF1273 family protein [Oscillospiraceae bacterium]MBR5262032.1 DUF1273 family protein [Oscillospiraceae bacterium]
MEKSTTCAFTGHRENKLAWGANELDPRCIELKEAIHDAVYAVYRSGVTHFICGMATGCDLYFCEIVMQLREEHPEVTLEAAIPWEGQTERWTAEQKKRYNRLVSECDYQTVLQRDYTEGCALRRNRYMVDSSRVLIAAYNGRQGGTMSTILYAMRNGVEIIEIPVD